MAMLWLWPTVITALGTLKLMPPLEFVLPFEPTCTYKYRHPLVLPVWQIESVLAPAAMA